MHPVPDIHCPYCHGKGYIYRPPSGKKNVLNLEICQCVEKYCECEKQYPYLIHEYTTGTTRVCVCKNTRETVKKIQKIFQNSHIPEKYIYSRLDSFQTDFSDDPGIRTSLLAAFDMAINYLENYRQISLENRSGLYIYGPTGTGKTMLASLILNELIYEYQVKSTYINITRDFFNPIRATFNTENAMYGKGEEIYNKIAQSDVLVIDDFGVQADSEWEKRTLYDLINARYESMKPTIITSNEEPKKWKDLFNGRIFSRLEEMTNPIFIESMDFRTRFNKHPVP